MRTYAGIIIALVIFGGGILVGRNSAQKEVLAASASSTSPVTVLNMDRVHSGPATVDFNEFWSVWDKVKAKYVKQPVNDPDLFYGAVQGLVASLGDPYSVFLKPQAAQEFANDLDGKLSGIGPEIGIKNNQIVVIAPLPDSPAEKKGLRPGDIIVAINKEFTLGMDIGTAVSKIRGEAGTNVTLAIGKPGVRTTKDVTITRAAIVVPSVIYATKPGNIGYVRVMQFNDTTMNKLSAAIGTIKDKKVSGLVVDLRNNPGGLLESAVDMASEWIDGGVIVSEKGTDGYNNTHSARGPHRLVGLPTVVLVNKGSASASEIVAGALQDSGAATIVGEKSFGKGSVQEVVKVTPDTLLKITVAKWLTPKGTSISEKGLTPDYAVKAGKDTELDPQLDKAVEVLKNWK